ncbi:MAG: response regulator transcription factor [Halobacteriovoraceae bacterium]|nr:response regulator transcription factor [Halobacteriovoraceae bacterium]
MNQKKILLIEDTKEIYQLVKTALIGIGDVVWKENLKEGQPYLKENEIDFLILDIELPDGNGVEFCAQLSQENPSLPIFLLTAHDEISEKVMGFSAGADDYITKPFNTMELKARVEAKLKKNELLSRDSNQLEWNELRVNTASQVLTLMEENKETDVELTALEYKLFMFFADNCNTVLPREKILDEIWGDDIHVYNRSVDTHVSKLRKKLGNHGDLIESVHGVGYKFSPTQSSL